MYRKKHFLIVLAAPSGGGKSTFVHRLLKDYPGIVYSVSYTTRAPRGLEEHGKDYFFVSESDFLRRVAEGEFLEHANVHGYWYGTSKKFIQSQIAAGKHVLLDIDVQGVSLIQATGLDMVSIFILPPSLEELKRRLVARATDNPEIIKKRIENSDKEIDQIPHYDYLVINKDIDVAYQDIRSILLAEENATKRYSDIRETFYEGE